MPATLTTAHVRAPRRTWGEKRRGPDLDVGAVGGEACLVGVHVGVAVEAEAEEGAAAEGVGVEAVVVAAGAEEEGHAAHAAVRVHGHHRPEPRRVVVRERHVVEQHRRDPR
eukprot:60096-Rhodomonas_salina.1